MPEIKDQNEPTMEEIIASIRRIIAEEDAAEPPPRANDDGILELTEMVAEDGSIVSVLAMAPVAAAAAPAATTSASPSDEPPTAAARAEEPAPRPAPRIPSDEFLSATSAAAAVAALSQLVREGSDAFDDLPPAPQRPAPPPGPTLEQTVRDMLRPMLAEWLDRNLPPLVEQIVRDEIARLGRAARPR